MALTNFVTDQLRPARMGNTSEGLMSGQVASSTTMGASDYLALIALIQPHFFNVPRVTVSPQVLTGTTYGWTATGRAF